MKMRVVRKGGQRKGQVQNLEARDWHPSDLVQLPLTPGGGVIATTTYDSHATGHTPESLPMDRRIGPDSIRMRDWVGNRGGKWAAVSRAMAAHWLGAR